MIGSWLASPECHRLAWTLLHFLWQGAAIALLYTVASSFAVSRLPRPQYRAACCALVAMALCPIVTWFYLAEPPQTEGGIGTAHRAFVTAAPMHLPAVSIAHPTTAPRPLNWHPYIIGAWMLGVATMVVRLLLGYAGTLELRSARQPLSDDCLRRLLRLQTRFRRPLIDCVFGSTRVAMATAVGYLRPVVLVPAAWLVELPADVLEAVIAHELAHIRRGDLWVVLCERLLCSLLFYHPAIWWICRQTDRYRELCCDELAARWTGEPVVYAEALTCVARRYLTSSPMRLAVSFSGERKMNLLERVRHVLGLRSAVDRPRWWPAGAAIAGILAVMCLAIDGGSVVTRWAIADEGPAAVGPRRGEGERPAAESTSRQRPASAEREGDRPAAETGEGQRRSPEAESTPRGNPRTREAAPQRVDQGRLDAALRTFRPANERERMLLAVIQQLRTEIAELRGERGEEAAAPRMREGDQPQRTGPRDGDAPRTGPRDGDAPRTGPRDGDAPRTGPRDGEGTRTGPRDGEGAPRTGPRDGEGTPRIGPRDGDAPRTGPRDGEAPKPGPRDGDR